MTVTPAGEFYVISLCIKYSASDRNRTKANEMRADTKNTVVSLGPAGRATIAVVVPCLVWLTTVIAMSWHPAEGDIDIAAGRRKFRDYCGACHIVEKGITTHHGPNLSEIGRVAASRKPGMTAAAYILESILEPAAFVAPTNRAGMPQNIARDWRRTKSAISWPIWQVVRQSHDTRTFERCRFPTSRSPHRPPRLFVGIKWSWLNACCATKEAACSATLCFETPST